ncbi:MAG: MoaD/ThiS family protein [Saprospiraceae bacterium]
MNITILVFGKLTDILLPQQWELAAGQTTVGSVRTRLETEFPALKGMRYRMAVDQKIATEDMPLTENAEVALLPPFSGG